MNISPAIKWASISVLIGLASGFQFAHAYIKGHPFKGIFNPPGILYFVIRGVLPGLLCYILYGLDGPRTTEFSLDPRSFPIWLKALSSGLAFELFLRSNVYVGNSNQKEVFFGGVQLLMWFHNYFLSQMGCFACLARDSEAAKFANNWDEPYEDVVHTVENRIGLLIGGETGNKEGLERLRESIKAVANARQDDAQRKTDLAYAVLTICPDHAKVLLRPIKEARGE